MLRNGNAPRWHEVVTCVCRICVADFSTHSRVRPCRTYLAGHELSLADVAIYFGLSNSNFRPPQVRSLSRILRTMIEKVQLLSCFTRRIVPPSMPRSVRPGRCVSVFVQVFWACRYVCVCLHICASAERSSGIIPHSPTTVATFTF